MKWKSLFVVSSLVLACLAFSSADAFATNPYGMEYSGGTPLSEDNVQINPQLIEGLTPLVSDTDTVDPAKVEITVPSKWEEAYFGSYCSKRAYFKLYKDSSLNSFKDYSWNIYNSKYRMNFQVINAVIDDPENKFSNNDFLSVALHSSGVINVGFKAFSDKECSTVIAGNEKELLGSDAKVYLEVKMKLYDAKSNNQIISDDLYFDLSDFDSAQSFKILNSSNRVSPDNMFTSSIGILQPEDSSLRNMYVANGGYLYSQMSSSGGGFDLPYGKSHLFIKINKDTQNEGLDVVHGFGYAAGVASWLYGNQYIVEYKANDGGGISGILTEDVISGANPSGTEVSTNEGFTFLHWVADVDVELRDGTKIKTGLPISQEQLLQVVVSQNVAFTAIFDETILVPNTGAPIEETNAIAISVSVFGLLTIVLLTIVLPKIYHKKVNFRK